MRIIPSKDKQVYREDYTSRIVQGSLFNKNAFLSEQEGCTTDKLPSSDPPAQAKHVYAVFEFVETDLAVVLSKCS